ncbi:MAG: Dihydroneopterin aldolase [Candidatus Tokpelaia sp. JSC188]|nr:MAG: Dihydroneopterin aldolase [Candidatus Tokpelaia sp. JSC188]
MTKLLLNIHCQQDAIIGIASEVDILDIAVNTKQELQGFEETLCALGGKVQLSLTVGVPLFNFHIDSSLLSRIDFLRIRTKKSRQGLDWSMLKQLAHLQKTILLINTDEIEKEDWHLLLQYSGTAGLYGVMLESYRENSHCLIKKYAITEIARFVEEARCIELAVGLGGTLEIPDIPRILAYHIDIIGFSVKNMARVGMTDLKKDIRLIRLLISLDRDMVADKMKIDMGTDRILVSDFKLPMYIGVYAHEHKKKQMVCFNVAVDIARVSVNPKNMSHIFSYDIILDRIHNLIALGHIDLIETLAEQIAAFILSYPQARRVTVRIEKLDLEPGAVGVEIIRTKEGKHSFL